jgi:hypothetical protein
VVRPIAASDESLAAKGGEIIIDILQILGYDPTSSPSFEAVMPDPFAKPDLPAHRING